MAAPSDEETKGWGWEQETFYWGILQVSKEWKNQRERESGTTWAAGVYEVERGDVTVGSLLPITSTHLLPYPATSCLGCMPRTQRRAPGPPLTCCPSPYLIILLLLINIHRLWAWEPLLSGCLVFALCTWWFSGVFTQSWSILQYVYTAAAWFAVIKLVILVLIYKGIHVLKNVFFW